MKAVIKQGIGCLDQQLNPNAFWITYYDDKGQELSINAVNEIEIVEPIIGKIAWNKEDSSTQNRVEDYRQISGRDFKGHK
jgi:hypothetical protein